MKQICSMLVIFSISLTLFFSCGKDEVENNQGGNEMVSSSTFYQDTIFYYGAANTIEISYEKQGEEYSLDILEGQVIVYFKEDISLQKVKNIISDLNGVIIEQIPYIGYYLIHVGSGNELDFISKATNNEIEYVSLNLVPEIKSTPAKAVFLDNFYYNNHGYEVQYVYDNCSGKKSIGYDFSVRNKNNKLTKDINQTDAINYITKQYPYDGLYNMSFGPSLSKSNPSLQWKNAGPKRKNGFIKAQQQQIKNVILRLKKLQKAGITNTIVTIAAGNEGIPNFDELILNPMLENKADENSLSNEEQTILKKNILIVSSKEKTSNNTKYLNNATGMVDTENLTYYDGSKLSGTSYAAPKALCIIRAVMDETGVSAEEAMYAVKEAIKNHDPRTGELVKSEAVAEAMKIKKTEGLKLKDTYFANTKWNVTETGNFKITTKISGSSPQTTTNSINSSGIMEFTKDALISDMPSNVYGVSISQKVTVINKGKIVITITTNYSGLTIAYNYTFAMESANSTKLSGEMTGGYSDQNTTMTYDVKCNGTRIK